MLDKKDLQAIADLMGPIIDSKIRESEQRMSDMMDKKLEAQLKPIKDDLRDLNLEMENTIKPQLSILAEGHQTILETLAPKSRVDTLEDAVSFHSQILKRLSTDVNDLKKAQ